MYTGVVASFDERVGWGEIALDDGRRLSFHCVAIADGSRSIAVGTAVVVTLGAHLGEQQASRVEPR